MKIRAFLVRVSPNGRDRLSEYLQSQEPVGIHWASYHKGQSFGLILVQAADAFDWTPLRQLQGVRPIRPCRLDRRYDEIPEDDRNDFRAAFEEATGMQLEGVIEDYEDMLCSILRALGESQRRRLRHRISQRTREFMDSFS